MSMSKQFRALRATLASLVAQLDALEAVVAGASECVHPEEDRKSLGTTDDPEMFQCGRCGEIVPGKKEGS